MFELNYLNHLEVSLVDQNTGCEFSLKDGRLAAQILRKVIPAWYSNITAIDDSRDKGGFFFAIRDGETDPVFQLRILTDRGINLLPSISKGGRRPYSQEDYQELLRHIDGWIVADVRSDNVILRAVKKSNVGYKASYSASKWDKFTQSLEVTCV